ncbi:hypothetical protein IE81DRAFT_244284 [Ceraceosorus guamensis]|uniref:Zinc/iron permease n=1 Tax=Ceraceosorus guamensis TaxID=1522189 RepID=A0A316WBG6_9BASI|nr:hypothetical protein IE81DRAFT_244284 [Ceraceosorus guamensis]PWN44945.1 hypothetical protein IE81DRAFT_244284 [Ceraceosorus guamensis]
MRAHGSGHLLGAGLLLGAATTVVLPEGVSALFRAQYAVQNGALAFDRRDTRMEVSVSTQGLERQHGFALGGLLGGGGGGGGSLFKAAADSPKSIDAEASVGAAILAGFMIMFIIDQIASPGAHVAPSHGTENQRARLPRPESWRLTRSGSLCYSHAGQDAASVAVEAAKGIASPGLERRSSAHDPEAVGCEDETSSPETLPADYHRSAATATHSESSGSANRGQNVTQARGLRAAFASVAGLVIHAAADGIAMGASAGSEDETLRVIVWLAIMIHKAPAAFGLCTLLIGQKLHRRAIRQAILIFALSTPLGAIITYGVLSVFLRNEPAQGGGIAAEHIGTALTFSAGTFLFVAMHAVNHATAPSADQEEVSSQSRSNGQAGGVGSAPSNSNPRRRAPLSAESSVVRRRPLLGRTGRIAILLLGSMLPKALQGLVGHHGH